MSFLFNKLIFKFPLTSSMMFFLFGCFSSLMLFGVFAYQKEFENNSIKTTAIIVDNYTHQNGKKFLGLLPHSPIVVFDTQNGQEVRSLLSSKQYIPYKIGDSLEIAYLSSNPKEAQVQDAANKNAHYFMLAFPAIFFLFSFIFFRIYKKKKMEKPSKITEKDFYKFLSFLTGDEQERKKYASLLTFAANDPDKFNETYCQDPDYEETLDLINTNDEDFHVSILALSKNSLLNVCNWDENYEQIALALDLPKYPTAHYPELQEIKQDFDFGIELADWVFKKTYPKQTLVFILTHDDDRHVFFSVQTSQLRKLRSAAKACNISLVSMDFRPL